MAIQKTTKTYVCITSVFEDGALHNPDEAIQLTADRAAVLLELKAIVEQQEPAKTDAQ